MRTWTHSDDDRPISVAWALVFAIALAIVVACLWLLSSTRADAAPRCGGPCPTYPTTTYEGTTTTPAPTTTVKPTTTTVGLGFCVPAPGVLCVNVDGTTTTVLPTTTILVTTTTVATTIPDTTAADQTVPPALIPPAVVTPAPTTAAPSGTLPVTGGNAWWLVLFGVCMLALGALVSTLGKKHQV